MITATLLSLFVLPLIYSWVLELQESKRIRIDKDAAASLQKGG